jgi:hypothetical protein
MTDIEESIRRAIEEGKFKDLPGEGKPLLLEDNPYENPEWRLAHHILRSSGFTLPWIERRREIENELEETRAALQRAKAWQEADVSQGISSVDKDAEWQRAVADFYRAVEAINKKILAYNLEAPSEQFHLRPVNAQAELQLTATRPSDTLSGTEPI